MRFALFPNSYYRYKVKEDRRDAAGSVYEASHEYIQNFGGKVREERHYGG
jgi:cation transport regulator ChaB